MRSDVWRPLAAALGQSLDFLRYSSPDYRAASYLRDRAEVLAPAPVKAFVTSPLGRSARAVRLAGAVLRRLENAVPALPQFGDELERFGADALLITPVVSQHSQQAFMRGARAAGYPVVLAVNSWDNLTNKGLVRELPDRTYVWNETQAREAVDLHGFPRRSVAVVGAHTFDHWFTWEPSRDRAEFCRVVGLDAERPFLLYACSSLQIAGDERPIVRRWLAAVRAHPALREVGVLVRPHPTAAGTWDDEPVTEDPHAAVWPPKGANPQDESRRRDYFDSLHHAAAVVGLNTSALIEAAIVGRRTFTFVVGDERNAQEGTLHFRYLLRENGGPLVVARSLEENVAHLADALESSEDDAWRTSFLESFVRPNGIHAAAAPAFVDDLERFLASWTPPEAAPSGSAALRLALAPLAHALYRIGYGRPPSRQVRTFDEGPAPKRRKRRLRKSLKRRASRFRGILARIRG